MFFLNLADQYLQEPFRKKQKFNVILSANFLFSNSCHTVVRGLIDDAALLSLSLLHHYVPNTEEKSVAVFNASVSAASLFGGSPTVPVMCGRLF